jgi:hypothetical protein
VFVAAQLSGKDARTFAAAEVAELELLVACKLAGRVRDLRLRVGERGVTLRGYARTYYAKQLAQHAVMEATDLPVAANEICVY